MNDLRHDLTGAADSFELPAGDLGSVVARGQARARRRQRLVATTAAVALVGASVAGLRLMAGGDPTTTLAAGGAAMSVTDGAISWEKVEPSSVLSLVQPNPTTAATSGRLYALSTAPGEADLGQPLPRVVWQSDDGVDWAAAPLSDDIFLSDLAASDERIYAVGTGPATAAVAGGRAVPEVVVGWSDDDAGSWQTAALDIDLPGIAAVSNSVSTGQGAAVATTPAGTVAIVTVFADLDVPRFLPGGITAPNGFAITPAGVDILGPAPGTCPEGAKSLTEEAPLTGPGRVGYVACVGGDGEERYLPPQEVRGVTATFTWDELGISGDVLRATLGQPLAFAAGPGETTFERVDLPLGGTQAGLVALHGDDQGFLLVVPSVGSAADAPPATTLVSSDGQSWTESTALPGGLSWVQAAGRVGQSFVVLGTSWDGSATVVTDKGGVWSSVLLSDLVGTDEPGLQIMNAAVGPGGVVVTLAGLEGDPAQTQDFHLLTSGDAVTWSIDSAADLADEPVASLGQPVIGGNQVVVPVALAGPRGSDDHLRQVALVATLP